MMIKIVEIIGKHCSQRDTTPEQKGGESIRSMIEAEWAKGEKVTISFEDVLTATPSFIDEAIGKLALNHSITELRNKLSFSEINSDFIDRINQGILLRLNQTGP